ncbi:uncharacterized protein PGTG_20065 [Puccinia graminis f. sp. tritici CRL 75-36-700-3]|uniref:OTU domain-containing protein n=1 Tax=Puccinia graminis f. sp. tritici (strain CRL 75-36-700-3 / race SCCL) TaxID=418459 RepID=E3NX78_PUCGT|nr:uncharacterized protein PGTG_20065 [Puccinia graminis f. sp. tritici CRL 75-36-700-3]EFP94177.1 hypothetical protein PGTG_20065 [Puccinia graminis f. sp. tritici CRL 75-36-700-3]
MTLMDASSANDRKSWGGEDHLAPISNALGVVLVVFNPSAEGLVTTYGNSDRPGPLKTYFLAFVNENHYEIIFNENIHCLPPTPPPSGNQPSNEPTALVDPYDLNDLDLDNENLRKFHRDAWKPINIGLMEILKNPQARSTSLPLVEIPYYYPYGLLDGWAITNDFIITENNSFYHAVSYWVNGNQDQTGQDLSRQLRQIQSRYLNLTCKQYQIVKELFCGLEDTMAEGRWSILS